MASATNPTPAANTNKVKESLGELRTALGSALKSSASNSVKLGVLVGVVAFGAQVTIFAAYAALGAGQGVAKGIQSAQQNN